MLETLAKVVVAILLVVGVAVLAMAGAVTIMPEIFWK